MSGENKSVFPNQGHHRARFSYYERNRDVVKKQKKQKINLFSRGNKTETGLTMYIIIVVKGMNTFAT